MAGLCERCMEREARSPHDLFCDECETSMNAHETHHASHPGATLAGVASVPTVDAAAVLASHVRREWLHWQPDDDGTGLEQYRRIGCAVCGEDWNTGGCTAVLLARRVVELEAALAKWDRWAKPPFVPGAAWPVGEE